jgi:2-oxo-4-hydroxy-4-carboxy-5-ureidoimidazoline decarboxylase
MQTHAAQSRCWSAGNGVRVYLRTTQWLALEEANRRYEQKFGRIFIVCATGKTSAEMLATLETRMKNDAASELREAAEQQRQITQLRLHRWLESE